MTVSACGMFDSLDEVVPDNTQEYRRAETMPPLDVPPDLSTSTIRDDVADNQSDAITFSEVEQKANPLAEKYGVTQAAKPSLAGEGQERHLIVPTNRQVTWQRGLEFWDQEGLEVVRENERIGMMDTEIGGDGYAYRMRVERGNSLDAVEVYIRGADPETANPQKDEAMLRLLADYLGVLYQEDQTELAEQKQSQPQVAAVTVVMLDEEGGYQALMVGQDFPDVWRRVGRILDSKGFAVEDRDRSRGTYLVRYIDPFSEVGDDSGWLDTLAFWQDDIDQTPEEFYNIKLISDAEETKIIILDAEKVRSSSDTAKRLLVLLQEQLAK